MDRLTLKAYSFHFKNEKESYTIVGSKLFPSKLRHFLSTVYIVLLHYLKLAAIHYKQHIVVYIIINVGNGSYY